jgi:hypothetical protein
MVVVQQTFDNPEPSTVRRVLRSTYVILRSEPFTNSRDKFQTSASFWSAFGWQVTPRGEASQRLFLPLISNDGQTLILVAVGVAMKVGDQEVMRIYKQQGNTAKLVRTLRLSEVWTHEEIEANGVFGEMGEEPMWYSEGSLEFSPDSRELLYRSRWNDRVRIKLANGTAVFERK